MKTLLSIFVLSLFVQNLSAQQMDESALQQAQQGNVTFMEGEFIAFLSDTVSPDYALSELEENGFEVVFSDINPVGIRVVSSPDSSRLEPLRQHPDIAKVDVITIAPDTEEYREKLRAQGLSGELLDQAVQRLVAAGPQQHILIQFNYNITSEQVKTIMGGFRDLAYSIEQDFPRTVNIKADPGEERSVMERAEQLPFVQSTALIAVLGN